MKGFLIKDIRLLLGQKKTLLVIFLIGLVVLMNENQVSCIGFIIMVSGIYAASTISYDEYDNGMAFLMTLPVARKTYIKEKYVLVGILTLLAMILAWGMTGVAVFIRNISVDVTDLFVQGIVMVCLIWCMAAVVLPFQLKLGAERGRIVLILGVLFFLGMALLRIPGVMAFLESFADWQSITEWQVITVCALLMLGIFFLSYIISVRIITKKEY